MNQQIKKCVVCGKNFAKKLYTSQKCWENKTKFCSKKCGDIGGHKKHTQAWKERMSEYHKTHTNSG